MEDLGFTVIRFGHRRQLGRDRQPLSPRLREDGLSFAVGSLVKARGREWVVLPESEDELLVLRPLGGTDEEVAGIYLPLETVEPATFALPDPV